MKSALPKVLHSLLGKPLLRHVIDLLDNIGVNDIIVVVGHGAQMVKSEFSNDDCEFVIQEEQLGTGHAVMCAEQSLKKREGDLLILCGDTPLFTHKTLTRFIREHQDANNELSILSAAFSDPTGYGRILRDEHRDFLGIVEEKDATNEQRSIQEVNTGVYLVKIPLLCQLITKLSCNNAQGEFYLTDTVELARQKGHKVGAFCLATEEEALGVNSRSQLADAEAILLNRIRSRHMDRGVTLSMPSTIYIEDTVSIDNDVTICPNCILAGQTVIGQGAKIGAFSYLENADIPSGANVPPYTQVINGKYLK